MYKKLIFAVFASVMIVISSCSSHYELTKISRSRILIDSRYDAGTDSKAAKFIAPYSKEVDSIMSPIVGKAAKYMAAERPESPLSNLLADILMWACKDYGEKPDFSVYNMGGIRAALAEGNVTYGNILDVAPFENKICFLSLKGDDVMELFSQIASVNGEGLSREVRMVMSKERKLVSVKVNGKEIEKDKTYRISTLDYLAQGNDKLEAFKKKTNVNSPQTEENNLRFIIVKYFKEQNSKGIAVDSNVEGRIIIKD